jgi:cytochrome c oxidase subunit 1
MVVGFNLTFFPMHFLGLYGQPRRTYQYDAGLGWDGMNMAATVGGFIIAFSTLVLLVNLIVSLGFKRGAVAGDDPWDARTLEWSISSPPPEYNFAEIPEVESRDDFWHRKYTEDADGKLLPLPSGGAAAAAASSGDGHGIHLPSPSFYPLVMAFGLLPLGYAAVYHSFVWLAVGVVILLFGMYAWAIEPPDAPHSDDDGGDAEHAPVEPAPAGAH